MKISSYYKAKGHEVGFTVSNPDKVYISCIFSKNLSKAKGSALYYPDAEVHIGGPAMGKPNSLPHEMEHVMPDYSLYPEMDYSMGFTTRGCVTYPPCLFCIVPELEPKYLEVALPEEFHHPDHKKIVFLDNNFTASQRFDRTLNYLKDNNLKGSFCQGLDARLITEEKAALLNDVRLWNLHFTRQAIFVAWDLIEKEILVLKGIQRLIDAGIAPSIVKCYVLVGFNTTHEQDFYRVQKLIDLGVEPYIMKYNGMRKDKWLNHLARWVNSLIYKKCDFQDYKPLKKDYPETWGITTQTWRPIFDS